MTLLKCKMCGGDIQATDNTYGTCDSCGTSTTLPKANDEKTVNLFNRANHFRRSNEFDKALNAYESILNEENSNAEAHWGVVLSRYGIEYVQDPRTNERIPTCQRVQFETILSDSDYSAALEYAPDEYTRSLYEEEAVKISKIQKGILAISNKEEPYDIFICYKETTDGGSRTKDSTIAQDIYYQLEKEGYKSFFAKITLEDKLGQQYEPYIFNALNSAKVMLVIGTTQEYFNSVWVKNEWGRFLTIMKNDRSRVLIPCYRDMDAYDMPDELSNLQSLDLGNIGFLQDLIRGVKKVFESSDTSIENKQSAVGHAPPVESVPVIIPKMFLDITLEKEQNDIMSKIDSLENEKDNLSGRLEQSRDSLRNYQSLQQEREKEVRETRAYGNYINNSDNSSLSDVIRAGSMMMATNQYNDMVKQAQYEVNMYQNKVIEIKNEITKRKSKLKKVDDLLRQTEEQRTERHYKKLLHMKSEATSEYQYTELIGKFREIECYKDSKSLAEECGKVAVEKKYKQTVQDMNRAKTDDEFYELARSFRGMNNYEDSKILTIECEKQYKIAKKNREEREKLEREQRAIQEEKTRVLREAEDRKEREKEQQASHWRESGLCEHCGGKLSFYTYESHGTKRYPLWYDFGNRVCKSCKRKNGENVSLNKKKKAIWTTGRVFSVIFALFAIIAMWKADDSSTGSMVFFTIINAIPFIGIFFCGKVGRIIWLIIGIIWNSYVGQAFAEEVISEGTAESLNAAWTFVSLNVSSLITAMIFPKND